MDIIDTGDRSLRSRRVESVAQASVALVDSNVALDPALAAANRALAADSTVLLKNDGVLPLAAGEQIAVFGRCQIDYFSVGYGSGGDVKAPYVWNLLDALRDAGATVDPELAALYSQWSDENPPEVGGWGTWPFSFPEPELDDAVISEAATRSRTAVVVIGRAAGEARDNKLEPGSFYLTDAELDLLDRVCAGFARVVVVVDTGSLIDFTWLERYGDRIGGLVLAWHGGMEGARGLADVLVGAQAPGGRLTSTIAREYSDYPSSASFGDELVTEYVEDVFVGYRYFETVAPERVLFPFGFGLGYTTFDVDCRPRAADGDTVEVDAVVTNAGTENAGRDVVQMYVRPPRGALAKPALSLIGFAKTGLLAPGESETVSLGARLADLASYDDTGATGHCSAWVLEAGTYEILIGEDVRSARAVHRLTIPETRVVEQLSEVLGVDPEVAFERMTLAVDEHGELVEAREPVPVSSRTRRERVEQRLESSIDREPLDGQATLAEVAAGTLSLDDFVAQLSLDELVALTRGGLTMNNPLGTPGNAGVFGGVTEKLRARGVPVITATDGPSGIRVAGYASLLPSGTAIASTWDRGAVEKLTALLGQEMVASGSDVILGPGINIQRDPLCGRNFEYFSEDPLLTGLMAASVVRGVQSEGVAACPKHFAANNQEFARTTNDSRVSERALREIYLRGFRICIEQSSPLALMTAYNKINGVWAYYNDDLATTVLREEWGFDGVVMTDWWTEAAVDPDFPALTQSAYRVRAQVDVLMPGGITTADGPSDIADDEALTAAARADGGLSMGELRRGAANVLRFALRSRAFARS